MLVCCDDDLLYNSRCHINCSKFKFWQKLEALDLSRNYQGNSTGSEAWSLFSIMIKSRMIPWGIWKYLGHTWTPLWLTGWVGLLSSQSCFGSFLEHFIQIRIQIWTRSAAESCVSLFQTLKVWQCLESKIRENYRNPREAQAAFHRLSEARLFGQNGILGWWHPTSIKKCIETQY